MAVIQVDLGRVAGEQGPPGQAATIRIGKVTAGDTPQVINTGSPTNAVLNFVLPMGQPAAQSVLKEEAVRAAQAAGAAAPASETKQVVLTEQEEQDEADMDGTLGQPWEAFYVRSIRQTDGLLSQCDVKDLDEQEVRLLECFRPVKGTGPDGKLHYGFLTGEAERALKEMGREPENFGVLGCEETQGRAYRWLAQEELLALAIGVIQALDRRVKQLEQEGR